MVIGRPKNAFTANFVGEANFLIGTMTEASAHESLVDIGDDLQLLVRNGIATVGERVVVAFRPECAIFEDNGKTNAIRGEVVDVLYSGSIVRLRIILGNGDFIVAKKAISFNGQMYEVGEAVTITIAPENIMLYSYPKDGLEKELALE